MIVQLLLLTKIVRDRSEKNCFVQLIVLAYYKIMLNFFFKGIDKL